MYQKTTKKIKAISLLLITGILSSCSTAKTTEKTIETSSETIPLIIETSSTEETVMETTAETYPNIEYSVDENGYLSATYDDLTLHLKVPETDVTSLPIYSVGYNYHPSFVEMEDSVFQQILWGWSCAGYGSQNAEDVEVNSRFIDSYRQIKTSEIDESALNQITELFPSREICDYVVSLIFESDTVYENYEMMDLEGNDIVLDDFNEYILRETLDSIPLGTVVQQGLRDVIGVDYVINGESYYGSIVPPDEFINFTDSNNVYTFDYYPISNYVIAQDSQPIIRFEDCIDAASDFVIKEQRLQRNSCSDIYAAELVYMIFYDFPDYACYGAEYVNYYLIPVWAFYYQLGGVSQEVRRGILFVDAYTGNVY